MHLRYGDAAPLELLRWTMAEKFGWTLGDVDALTLSDLSDYLQIEDARSKVRNPNG